MNKLLIITSLCLVPGLMRAAATEKKLTRAEKRRARAARHLEKAMATDGKKKEKHMARGAALDRPTCMLYVTKKKKEKRTRKKGGIKSREALKWARILTQAFESPTASKSTREGCARDLGSLFHALAQKAKKGSPEYAEYAAKAREYQEVANRILVDVDVEAAKTKLEKDAKDYTVEEAGELSFDQFLAVMYAQINQ